MKHLLKKNKTLTYNYERALYENFIEKHSDSSQNMINSASNIFFDIEENSFSLLIPLKDRNKIILTKVPEEIIEMISTMIHAQLFSAKQETMLIAIKSNTRHNSSFLLMKNLETVLAKYIDIDDNARVLISDRINLPLYIGHYSIIERLVESSDFKYKILNLKEVIGR